MIKYLISFALVLCFSLVQAQDNPQDHTEAPLEDLFVDDIVQRSLVEDSKMWDWTKLREADISWEKRIWRIIDTREKMNLSFRYENAPFFQLLTGMVENGDIAVFRDEYFKEPMTMDDIEKTINRIDTTTVFDYDTYEEKIEIVKNTINWEDIRQFRVKEIWYYNEATSRMEVRIIGMAPIKDEIDYTTGELKYSLPLFWVYYPQAKDHFAKHRVFNDFNDIAPMSWYDLFESRFFASYIIKRSNPLDLRIKDIYDGYDNAGIDRLLEARKIEDELFNFEHDLWEY